MYIQIQAQIQSQRQIQIHIQRQTTVFTKLPLGVAQVASIQLIHVSFHGKLLASLLTFVPLKILWRNKYWQIKTYGWGFLFQQIVALPCLGRCSFCCFSGYTNEVYSLDDPSRPAIISSKRSYNRRCTRYIYNNFWMETLTLVSKYNIWILAGLSTSTSVSWGTWPDLSGSSASSLGMYQG